jgi:hypothetical protein
VPMTSTPTLAPSITPTLAPSRMPGAIVPSTLVPMSSPPEAALCVATQCPPNEEQKGQGCVCRGTDIRNDQRICVAPEVSLTAEGSTVLHELEKPNRGWPPLVGVDPDATGNSAPFTIKRESKFNFPTSWKWTLKVRSLADRAAPAGLPGPPAAAGRACTAR